MRTLSRLLGLLVCASAVYAADVTVTVDPAERHQTILGWGKTTPWLPASPLLRDLTLERAVDDLGLNRLRFEGFSGNSTHGRSWEWANDDGDPHHINWAGFDTARLDERAAGWLLPFKQAVERRGERFNLYVSPSFFRGGSSGDLPPWLAADPQEYAEWALALLLRLRDTHGITADFYSICNEAGNDNDFTPEVVARMMKALVPRLREAGLPTAIQFPESVNAHVAMNYLTRLQDDPQIWEWIGLLSYHWYGGNNQEGMRRLAAFALERGLPTAQTEFMGLTVDHLYDDLTIGNVSYWEVYGLATPDYQAAHSHVSSTSFRGGDHYWQFRSVLHYVRPGSVRLGGASTDPALRVLAFSTPTGTVAVLLNTGQGAVARTVAVAGLPAGRYGACEAAGTAPYRELGPRAAAAGQALEVAVPPGGVLTLYPRQGGNLPPVPTTWRTTPEYLTLPANALELSATAVDPDLDTLSYSWSVVAQPPGAQATIADPAQATATARGLSVAGEYRFAVAVSDGAHAVRRELSLQVFGGNQPPVPGDVHNRRPVRVTVRDGGTLLRAVAFDLERDPLQFRWSTVRQPEGAAAVLETPLQPACKVTGMTLPGDYVFRVEVSDPTHTVPLELTVPVYP